MHTEKKTACVVPPRARATARTAKLGATAARRLLAANTPVVISSSRLRGMRLVASVNGTASTATSPAYRLTSRPIVDGAEWNVRPMAGSRPTGNVSVVTPAKMHSAISSRPVRAGPSPVASSSGSASVVSWASFRGWLRNHSESSPAVGSPWLRPVLAGPARAIAEDGCRARTRGPIVGGMQLEFSGEVWGGRGPAPYYFVTVPDPESAALQDISPEVTYGWGMIPVEVEIGATTFNTSLWP